MSGKLLLIYICNFHVLSHLLLIYICKLHWNPSTLIPGSLLLGFENVESTVPTGWVYATSVGIVLLLCAITSIWFIYWIRFLSMRTTAQYETIQSQDCDPQAIVSAIQLQKVRGYNTV